MTHAGSTRPSWTSVAVAAVSVLVALGECRAAALHVGAATTSITPDRPVALAGQTPTRIARSVASPVTATALPLESRDSDTVLDQAVLVSCDLVVIEDAVLARVRQLVGDRISSLDRRKVVLSATHTHTAPVMKEGNYEIPKEGVMQPAEYAEFLSARIADVVAKAWEARRPGRVGW